MLDISEYKPGRFAYLMCEPFVPGLWQSLSSEESHQRMATATAEAKTAISPLLETIEQQYAAPLTSPKYPEDDVGIFINNMIKQLMERQGYEHVACGLCRGKYIKTSGVYRLRTPLADHT